eukprot:365333-Chlamydomonas_euryale.AAC.28
MALQRCTSRHGWEGGGSACRLDHPAAAGQGNTVEALSVELAACLRAFSLPAGLHPACGPPSRSISTFIHASGLAFT